MSNLSDKDIDRLSRDAAEFYEPDDGMLSWNKLEQQLVKHIPERPPDVSPLFRIKPLIWGPSVLLLAGLTYFFIKTTAYRSHSTLKIQTESIPVQPGARAPLTGVDKAQDNARPVTPDNGQTRPADEPSLKSNSGNKDIPDASKAPALAKAHTGKLRSGNAYASGINTMPGRKEIHLQHTAGDEPSVENAGPGAIQNNISSAPASAASKQTILTQRSATVQLPSVIASNAHPFIHVNDSSLNRRFAAADKEQNQPVSKSLQINRSLVIGLVTGPDYTDVGSKANDQLSNNIGISLGYYLTNRLSVNTGFQYTTKYYWSDGKPFQPQPQSLNSSIVMYAPFPHIESVNGRCNMFEIPLTLRYDIYQHDKIRLFVNAGFSSYLIRKQDYTYFFHNAGRAYQWQNENNEHRNYWFGVGNISAGIEQDLGRGFSFQAEPFVRLPFSGIGVGNMKMNSFGMLFSIRYSPVLGRKRK